MQPTLVGRLAPEPSYGYDLFIQRHAPKDIYGLGDSYFEALPLHLRHLPHVDFEELKARYFETHRYVKFMTWDVVDHPAAQFPVAMLVSTVPGWDIWYPDATRPGHWVAGPVTEITSAARVLCRVWRELYGDIETEADPLPVIGTVATVI